MSVTLTTINGQIAHENRAGAERFYVPDPLGNTAALVDTSGAVTDTWNYWPYGEVQGHGGSSKTPFTFLGVRGYFADLLIRAYVRTRDLREDLTGWMSVDLIWPSQSAYGYVSAGPARWADPSGLGDDDGGLLHRLLGWVDTLLNPPSWMNPIPTPKPPFCIVRIPKTLRHASMIRNWNYFTWHWGNCCGLVLQCGPGHSNGTCLDNACERHDKCVGPVSTQVVSNWIPCARQFCHDLKKCYARGGCASQMTPSGECQNTWEAGTFFCALAGQVFP